jgi:hypothetical protein
MRVRLDKNQLTANITHSFGVYPNSEYMDLSDNNLYGHQLNKKLPPLGHCLRDRGDVSPTYLSTTS